jgi:hypothetical protein
VGWESVSNQTTRRETLKNAASRKAPRLDVLPTFLLFYNYDFITFPLALAAKGIIL